MDWQQPLPRSMSYHPLSSVSCDHQYTDLALPLSDESFRRAPVFLSEIGGAAGPSTVAVPSTPLRNLSQAYAIARSCEAIASYAGHSGYRWLKVVGRPPEVIDAVISKPIAHAMRGRTPAALGTIAIVIREFADSGGFGDSISEILDELGPDPPDAWVMPISMQELDDSESLPGWLTLSDLLLPVCSGPKTTWLCAVGVSRARLSDPISMASRYSRVQWYDRFLRPARTSPDVCYDCAMMRRHVLSRVSADVCSEMVEAILRNTRGLNA